MGRIKFGVIGAGWRTEFFVRIAKALPDRFEITGIMTRDAEKGKKVSEAWGVRTCTSIDELLGMGNASFVIVSVPWSVAPLMTRELAGM